jgi:hypothetical protein
MGLAGRILASGRGHRRCAQGCAAWLCISAPGKDGENGRSFRIRGTWAAAKTYKELDLVMLNGTSFVAKRDAPGDCPGEGWQVVALVGKKGAEGDRGPYRAEGHAGRERANY